MDPTQIDNKHDQSEEKLMERTVRSMERQHHERSKPEHGANKGCHINRGIKVKKRAASKPFM